MAVQVNVAGVTTISVGTGSAGALETLGFSRDQPETIDRAYWLDIPGDQNGGEAGPPIDIQYMGQIAIVRVRMTKFERSVFQELTARLKDGTFGTPGFAGTLMFQESKTIRVLLNNANDPINYPRCLCREPIEMGRGTRFSEAILEFEAHRDANGVLHNTTIS